MNFLWPIAAWLAVLALPILLFYLIRQRLRVKPVTTLLFWENLSPKVHNRPLWRKLRRLLSLLLQLLLLGLLILALAHPIPPGQSLAASSTVLVLDPSVTMTAQSGARTRWDDAVAAVERRLGAMRFGDEATLLLATDPPQILSPWTGRASDLRRQVEAAKPVDRVTDIRAALRLAQNLRASRPGARIVLASDTVWTVAPPPELLHDVDLEAVGGPLDNSGITLFAARPLPVGGGEYELAVRLEQNTARPISGQLEVRRDDALMDVVPVTLAPGQPFQKFWREQSTGGATFTAAWKPDTGDGFARDQSAVAHLAAPRELNVTLVSPPNLFLEAALASQNLIKSHRVWPAPDAKEAPDLWIVNRAAPPAQAAGAPVILIDPPGAGFWGERAGPIDKPLVSEQDRDAPIMRFADLGELQLRRADEFHPAPGAHVYLDSFGKPLIFGHWDSAPRWLVIAFDLDQSDFVFRTAFPILAGNIVETLRPDAEADASSVPGPVATQMKQLAPATTAALPPPARRYAGALPLWWWIGAAALLLLVLEWSFYSQRITE